MSFAPCCFSLESATAKRRGGAVDPSTVAGSSPYYSLTDYPNRVVLASAIPTRYTYWIFASAREAAEYVANSVAQERMWFFQIEKDRPVFAYMDFDRPMGSQTCEAFYEATRRTVALFCCYVTATYSFSPCQPDGGAGLYDGTWWFYEACTAKKLSMHAHSRMTFANVEALNHVMGGFRRWLTTLHKAGDSRVDGLYFPHKGVAKCIADFDVYTKRPFRLPLNCKGPGEDNFLRPLHKRVSQVDEILRGFVHPYDQCHPTLTLPDPHELLRVRALRPDPAVCNTLPLASCALSKFVRDAYKVAKARDFCQSVESPPIVDAALGSVCGAEMHSLAGVMVERALFGDMPRFLDFEQRGMLLQVAWETMQAFGNTRVERMATQAQCQGVQCAQEVPCPLDEFDMQVAYVALEMATRAYITHNPPLVDFLRASRAMVAPLDTEGMEEFRLAANRFLWIPLNRTPLASLPLAPSRPFHNGDQRVAPIGAYR